VPEAEDNVMMIDTNTTAQRDIVAILDAYVTAHAERDAEGLMNLYAPNAVSYMLAPPLQQAPDTAYGSVEGLRRWFATFAGPVRITHRDPVVTVDGTVAFVHTLSCMTSTKVGAADAFTLWFRSTFGLRRLDGAWRIAHRHDSTPFYMDEPFRAAVDLQP
jgi:ketosteroid isomerase-like protein